MSVSENTQSPPFILEIATLVAAILLGAIAALIIIMLIVTNSLDFSPLANTLTQALPATLPAGVQTQLAAMGLPLGADSPAYWYMSRVSALLGFLFMWLSTLWGLLLSTKLLKKRVSPAMIFSTHEFLSLAGLGFILFHAFVLLGDQYIKFGLSDILLPFSASFKPNLVGIGTLGLYLYTLLVGSFYLRKKIGQQTWRALHYTSFLAFIFAAVHGIFIGTDSGLTVVRVMYLSAMGSIFALMLYRIAGQSRRAARRTA